MEADIDSRKRRKGKEKGKSDSQAYVAVSKNALPLAS